MKLYLYFIVMLLVSSLSLGVDETNNMTSGHSKMNVEEMKQRPLILQKASWTFGPILKSCHSSHSSHWSHRSHQSHRSHYSSR